MEKKKGEEGERGKERGGWKEKDKKTKTKDSRNVGIEKILVEPNKFHNRSFFLVVNQPLQ